jgi:catechol 2,3-dioxygenase-like lactoylglutathione lyase family enzyme
MAKKKQKFDFETMPHCFEISIVVKDLEKTKKKFNSLLGMTPYQEMEGPLGDHLYVHGKKVEGSVKCCHYRVGPVKLELAEPIEGETIYKKFLDKHGVGVQHIGFRVSDLDKEIARFKKRGIGIVQRFNYLELGEYGFDVAYLDTEDFAGCHFELAYGVSGEPGDVPPELKAALTKQVEEGSKSVKL